VPLRNERDDAEPVTVEGKPLTFAELQAIAEIKPNDVSAALDRFSDAVAPRYRNLLD
jgi:hypothetical protein